MGGDGCRWFDKGLTPVKGKAMAMTEVNFNRVIAMRDELIMDQRNEISKLKMQVNKLKQRIESINGKP